MDQQKNSYLLTDLVEENLLITKVVPYTQGCSTFKNFWVLPQFFSEAELLPFESCIQKIRLQPFLSYPAPNVGTFFFGENTYKYISHASGRYDVWQIGEPRQMKVPPQIQSFGVTCQSVGALLLDAHTATHGKWHKDAVDLFKDGPSNAELPPFYFNVLIALHEQKEENGPTQFYWNDDAPGNDAPGNNAPGNDAPGNAFWVPLKRGDAILFDGNVKHRGTANRTGQHRDLLYATYTPPWYNEEKL